MVESTTEFDAYLDAVEMDLLCTFAGVPAPFPLRVPSVGATEDERRMIFHDAGAELADRGLADARGPRGVAEVFVRLLRTSPAALDLMLAIGEDRLGAVLLASGGDALLAIADLNETPPGTRLVALPLDDAVDELLCLIPELDAARTTPFTLPRRAVREVYRVLLDRARGNDGRELGTHELDELLATHGIDERLVNRMVTQLQPVLGNGQAGLTERRGYAGDWRRFGEELRWLDTEQGRFRLGGDADWTSVNPLFPNELYTAIRRLAAEIG
jgi:hypothetical protein